MLKIERAYTPDAPTGLGISLKFGHIGLNTLLGISYTTTQFYAGNFDQLNVASGFYDVMVLLLFFLST